MSIKLTKLELVAFLNASTAIGSVLERMIAAYPDDGSAPSTGTGTDTGSGTGTGTGSGSTGGTGTGTGTGTGSTGGTGTGTGSTGGTGSSGSGSQEPTESNNTKMPVYTLYGAQIAPGDRTASVRLRRDGPTNYSVSMRWNAYNGDGGAYAPDYFDPNQQGEFVFDRDVDEITIPVKLNRDFADGQSVLILIGNFRIYDNAPTLAIAQAHISTAAVELPQLGANAVSRDWNKPIKRAPNPAWTRDFYTDLVTDFTCNDTGVDAAGKPCFTNSLPGGRAQLYNGETGLYSDPMLHGTNPLQMLDGKRLLCVEKLATPFALSQGGVNLSLTQSNPLVSTEKNAMLGYGRFEYRLALLDMQQGCWPAGWSVCLPHYRWPNCEQDTFEINYSKQDYSQIFPFTTNHWGDAGTSGHQEGQFANVFELIPGFNYADQHTYWHEWTPDYIAWGIDDVLVFSAPNRFFMKDRNDPNDANRVNMMIQIATGGAGGDASQGNYPIAPSTYAPGNPAMQVEHMAHYAMPLN